MRSAGGRSVSHDAVPTPGTLTGSGPAGFSAARLDGPFPLPISVGGDGLRERSCEVADRARVCQRVGEDLRRLRAEHQQLVVLVIDLGLPPDGDGLLGEAVGRLAAATRATDTVALLAPGRIVLVAEGVSCGVHALVDVLRDRCERVFARPVSRGMRYTIGPRVGAAVAVDGTAVTAERLLAQAEAAMPADVACVWVRSAAR